MSSESPSVCQLKDTQIRLRLKHREVLMSFMWDCTHKQALAALYPSIKTNMLSTTEWPSQWALTRHDLQCSSTGKSAHLVGPVAQTWHQCKVVWAEGMAPPLARVPAASLSVEEEGGEEVSLLGSLAPPPPPPAALQCHFKPLTGEVCIAEAPPTGDRQQGGNGAYRRALCQLSMRCCLLVAACTPLRLQSFLQCALTLRLKLTCGQIRSACKGVRPAPHL